MLRNLRAPATPLHSDDNYIAYHNRTVLSQLPDTTFRPSGLNDTDLTLLECPSSVCSHSPVNGFRAKLLMTGRSLQKPHHRYARARTRLTGHKASSTHQVKIEKDQISL